MLFRSRKGLRKRGPTSGELKEIYCNLVGERFSRIGYKGVKLFLAKHEMHIGAFGPSRASLKRFRG